MVLLAGVVRLLVGLDDRGMLRAGDRALWIEWHTYNCDAYFFDVSLPVVVFRSMSECMAGVAP